VARLSLTEIGRQEGTDKVDKHHTFQGECYLDVYEKYFAKWRDEPVSLLEIGVKRGASIRTWERFFDYSPIIVGFDYDPRCANVNYKTARIICGDQENPADLDRAVDAGGGGFDIIIDDGSHVNRLTLASFRHLWKYVRPGGLYVLEDMKCTYLGDRLVSEQKRGNWRGRNIPETEQNNRADFDEFLRGIIEVMDHLGGSVRALHLHPMTYVLEKV
jgi:hypothetical protein